MATKSRAIHRWRQGYAEIQTYDIGPNILSLGIDIQCSFHSQNNSSSALRSAHSEFEVRYKVWCF